MPRCHIRCNVITDPDQSAKNRLRCADILPYLQCFYHVPIKVVYEVLGMSHHTMAPLRRKWNLKRWPFADICRGAFQVDGLYVTWDDVDSKRKAMIAMPDTDPRIARILKVMGERARHHKHKVNTVIALQRKEQQRVAIINTTPEKKETEKPQQEEPIHSNTLQLHESAIPSDADWLEDLSRLLAAELDAPPGELFPPLFESL